MSTPYHNDDDHNRTTPIPSIHPHAQTPQFTTTRLGRRVEPLLVRRYMHEGQGMVPADHVPLQKPLEGEWAGGLVVVVVGWGSCRGVAAAGDAAVRGCGMWM